MRNRSQSVYRERKADAQARARLEREGQSALMARLLASRGVQSKADLLTSASELLSPRSMKGCVEAGQLLAQAIVEGKKVCVVADYDCDGASACAVILRGMRQFGAAQDSIEFVVPDRAVHGYGLTPPVVDLALNKSPWLLVTVDNGIASFDGVRYARERGLKVMVTDHHLTALVDGNPCVPDADVVVNPNQPGCTFASKSICGAGVAFYTMLSTRHALREQGWFLNRTVPQITELLDLVALATVADVVRLDANNRLLVELGMKLIRAGRGCPGIAALLDVSSVAAVDLRSEDFGFRLGPRVNAAGRLADMRVGIECLSTEDSSRAHELAEELQSINTERRAVEGDMTAVAGEVLDSLADKDIGASVVIFDEGFHEGVVGIVAGRIKDAWNRPTFVFAKSNEGTAKGSGRSIPGLHLRDVLDLISKLYPDLLLKFGGHAMAAGVTVKQENVEAFAEAFEVICTEMMSQEDRHRIIWHDGSLARRDFNINVAGDLDSRVWGHGFEKPLFLDRFRVTSQRIVGEKHLKLSLEFEGEVRDAIWFGRVDPVSETATLAYTVDVNEWNGRRKAQMLVKGEAPT